MNSPMFGPAHSTQAASSLSLRHTLRYVLMLAACLPLTAQATPHSFVLHGGHFYGPGPIVPDTPLPEGSIRGISFDMNEMSGVAIYSAEGGRLLSDGVTTTNGNIDAGVLEIGGNGDNKSFWLSAVAGGPNEGEERYRFDEQYRMIWNVDLALDPGFAEGIVRVDGFELTTGAVEVPKSIQTQKGMPGGYDKAGSLVSGTTLVGRVGDFDADGFLDGIIVATANVPMQADLLPGAPVGNVRGFRTDIPVDPLFAMELTLRGVANMRPQIEAGWSGGHLEQLTERLKDIRDRLLAARANYETAFISANKSQAADLREIGWRLESVRQLFFIPLAFLSTYDYPSGEASESIRDASDRALTKAAELAEFLKRRRTGGKPE